MATQAIEQAPTAEEASAPSPKGGKRMVMILALAGVAAGSAAGLLGLGPVLAKRRAAAPAKKVEEAPSTSVTHQVDNLVLNPAGSNGTRFLMVTATFELKDGGTEQSMKDHEAEVRDRILGLLGKKTVDELTDIGHRDEIKKEVLLSVDSLFPEGTVLKVFFPQFVIQ